MQSKLTLIGLYNYYPTLFDKLSMPAGVDVDIVRDEILIKSGEFEVLYPDPNFLKDMIGHWSKKYQRTFQKWVDALQIDYDPLNNYDRKEEYIDSKTASSKMNIEENNTSAGSSSGSTTGSTSPAQTTNTKETQVSAYDAATYQNKEKTTDTLSLQVAGSDTSKTASNTVSNDKKTASHTGADNEIIKHSAHLFGNIGVTTSQQMLQAELDVQRFNLYEQIADIFVIDFCIMVY